MISPNPKISPNPNIPPNPKIPPYPQIRHMGSTVWLGFVGVGGGRESEVGMVCQTVEYEGFSSRDRVLDELGDVKAQLARFQP